MRVNLAKFQDLKFKLFLGGLCAFILAGTLVFLRSSPALATNPNLISFQGKVVNANGTNVTDGTYNFDFVLYDDVSLGTPSDGVHDKWHELSKSVTVTNGIFQTNLGSATALPNFNSNPTLYLAIKFNGDAAGYMSPRVQMTSVPYALNSDSLGGLGSSAFGQLAAASQTWTGTNTFQPTTNITSAIVKQTSSGSPTADIFNVQTANSTNILQVTGPAANEAAVTLKSVGATRDLTLDSASGTLKFGSATTTLQKSGTAFSFDLNNASNSTLTVTNAGAGVASLSVEGGVTVGTDLAVNGNTTLGDATSDTVTFTGRVNSSILPSSNDAVDLGDDTHRWRDLYLAGDTVHLGTGISDETLLSYNTTSNSLVVKPASGNNSTSAVQIQNAVGEPNLIINTTSSSSTIGLTNTSFESGTTGWANRTGCTLSNVTAQYFFGFYSGKCANTATANAGMNYNLTLSNSTQYTFSFYIKTTGTTGNVIDYGYSYNGVNETTYRSQNNYVGTSWSRVSYTFTPTGITGTPYLFIKQNDATARDIFIDGVQIEATSAPNPYAGAGTLQLPVIDRPLLVQPAQDGLALEILAQNGGFNKLFIADTSSFSVGLAVNTGPSANARLQIGDPSTPDYVSSALAVFGDTRTLVAQAGSGTTNLFVLQDSSGNSLWDVSNTGVTTLKNSSSSGFMIKNGSNNEVVTVDTANSQLVLGKALTLNGKLVFRGTGSGDDITLQSPSSYITGYTLTLPDTGPSTSQCLQTDSVTASLLVFGSCGSGGGLAKNATDTSSASVTAGNYLYVFTNSGSTTGGVLSVANGTNTGNALNVTSTGTSGTLLFASNNNGSYTGSLLDLQSGSSPTSKFSVNQTGSLTMRGNLIVDNNSDGSLVINLDSGATTTQNATLEFADQGTIKWNVRKTTSNIFSIIDEPIAVHRLQFSPSGISNYRSGSTTSDHRFLTSNDTDLLYIADTVRLGVGTTAPSAELTFNEGATRTINVLTRTTNTSGNDLTVVAGAGGSGASANAGGNLNLQGGAGSGTNGNGGNVVITGGAANGVGTAGEIGLMSNVGIGTSNPDRPLQISGVTANDASQGGIAKIGGSLTSTSNNQNGLRVEASVSPGGALSANKSFAGIQGVAQTNSTEATMATYASLLGITGYPYVYGSASVSSAYGGYFQTDNASSGTIAASYGAYAANPFNTGGGAITKAAGLVSENITSGSSGNTNLLLGTGTIPTGNYSIYSSSTYQSYLAGQLGIGTGAQTIYGTTERLLQVGSPTGRGNAAVYGDLVSKGLKDLTTLSNIKDIFIYDTTADSDGGRWIDWSTTERQPWYTETLDDSISTPCDISTMDRCYSQQFPRKAILVVTTNALYIFDGQNNVMWMKFTQNASGYALGVDTNNDPSSVTAQNGVIYVGTKGSSAGGLYAIDFTQNRMWNYDDTDRSAADVGIDSRNSAVTYNSDNNTNFDLGGNTGWKTINDVSVAIISFSSTAIAATTGPVNGVVLLGLATDSGVVVINLSQQRLLQYSRATDDEYNAVYITKSARAYALDSTRDELNMWNSIDSDVANQVNTAADKAWDETTTPALTKTTPVIGTDAPDALEVVERGSLSDSGFTAGTASDLIYVGTDQGLTEIHDNATFAAGWVKYYSTTRQTALQPATIRRVHMMDDASGNVTNQSSKTSIMAAKGTPTYGVSGVRGTAMSFNGTSQYLCSDANSDGTCDNDTTDNMTTGSWTITVWFKHSTSISGTDVLFARCYNATPAAAAGCVAASMPSTGVMTVNVDFDATWTIGVTGTTVFHTSTQTYNDNQWHFLMITRAQTTGNINTMIDGKPIGQTAGVNTTLDASQIFGIGTDCSSGVNCSTGGNFWDGAIDDFTFDSAAAGNNNDQVGVAIMRRLYNDARPLVNKRVVTVTDATSATTSTIVDSGETWTPNEFSGQIVTLTGGTGAGQTRRIVSNTATSLSVSPDWSTTPDTSTDFKIDPEALYGATSTVKAIGITSETPLGEARQMCVGTNDGSDGGGVSCYNHNAGPNLIADVYHGDSEQADDSGVEWTGTDYDDIQSIDISSRLMVMGNMASLWTQSEDVRLGQGLDYIGNKLFDIRAEIINDTINGAGSFGIEVGLTGGADLAENYTSDEVLAPGEVVTLKPNNPGSITRASKAYDKDVLGIVATAPGLVLGSKDEQSYPVALVGRVPVLVTNENGDIKSGDKIASAATPGYAMKAVQAGRVLGTALEDLTLDKNIPCPEGTKAGVTCGQITVFVNLVDFNGQSVEVAISEAESAGLDFGDGGDIWEPFGGLLGEQDEQSTGELNQAGKILKYLSGRQSLLSGTTQSEVLTDKVSTVSLNSSKLYAQNGFVIDLAVDKLRANKIEGLELFKVNGSAEFKGNALFKGLVTFVEKTVFDNDITFNGRTTFNSDTAGFAVIKKNQKEVKVVFSKPHDQLPVVTVTTKNGSFAQYTYKDLTVNGFTILLKDPAAEDIEFAWTALSVKDAKTTESEPAEQTQQ